MLLHSGIKIVPNKSVKQIFIFDNWLKENHMHSVWFRKAYNDEETSFDTIRYSSPAT